MRMIPLALAFISFFSVRAQSYLPAGNNNYPQQGDFNHYQVLNDSNRLQQNWSVSIYAGIATGFAFFNNGISAFLPASIGVQLNRRLTNNLYAFAGVSAAPAFFYFNRSFNNGDLHQNFMSTPQFNANGLGIYSGVHAGLMYVNDAKTFSISGSIGVSHNSYPFYSAPQRHSAVVGTKQ